MFEFAMKGEDEARPQEVEDGVCIKKVTDGDGCPPSATPPPRTAFETLKLCCVGCCFLLAFISLAITICHTLSTTHNMESPRFQVESVSVTLELDNVAYAHDLFQLRAKWNILFSVQNRTTSFDYDSFNVRVVCLSHQGLSGAVLRDQDHTTNNNTTTTHVLNATANTSLYPKDFARLVQGDLEFDVVLRAQAGKHIHEASCKDMRVEFLPWALTKGTMVGGPKSCHLLH